MINSTIIRRSPIIVIRNFIAIEIIAFFFYFLALGHGSLKYDLYTSLFFSKLIPYDTAKLVFLSGAQLLITIFAFMSWYYEYYKISQNTISHSKGVFFKKRKIFPLDKFMTITSFSGPLGKLLHYGSINLKNSSQNSIILKTISYSEDYLKTIKKAINPISQRFNKKPDINEVINQEENEKLEFKSSFRFDHKIGQFNRDLEKASMKNIAAFLNSKGGFLVLGISDSGEILGLENDYQTIQRKNSDGFENHFTQAFNSMIGPEFRNLIKLWFYQIKEKEICLIQVAPSSKPVYLKLNNNEHFYIRTGNIVTDLKFSEVENYKRSHWKKT
ncbi:putative DNA binding domain-containing protein [Candidatus Wolfebacteria bacterium]|nr:putative DNA binding domain-containing protein [Candidatus Wolfebacteria bacterium]